MMRPVIGCILLLTLSVGHAVAQDAAGQGTPAQDAGAQGAAEGSNKDRDEILRQLVARVESLEAEVRQLRAEKAQRQTEIHKDSPSRAERSSVTDADKEIVVPEETQPAETFPQFKLRGFADIDYHLADEGPDKNAFRLGQLDLFITSRLAEDVNVLSENVIEANEENEFGFEIERLLLQWTPRDYFNLAVGRYHTAIGYYNNAYHHGKWLQTAVGRPTIFNFEDEGGLLPIHNVGVSLSGVIPSGSVGLHYVAEIGNGRNYTPGQEAVQNLSDNNDFKALNFAIFARPEKLPGLQIGASVYFDRLDIRHLPEVDQTIFSGHAVYVSPMFEWLNEVLVIHHSSDLGSFTTTGFYTQVARQFGKFRPYARFELLDASDDDLIIRELASPGLQETLSLGIRYNFTELGAVKLEGSHSFHDLDDDAARNQLTLQVAFTF
jgi:TolA-binding protein